MFFVGKGIKRRKAIPFFLLTVFCVFSFALFATHPSRVLVRSDKDNGAIEELSTSGNDLSLIGLPENSEFSSLSPPIEILTDTRENSKEISVPPIDEIAEVDNNQEDTADEIFVNSVDESVLPTLQTNSVQEVVEESRERNGLQNILQESISNFLTAFGTTPTPNLTKETALEEQKTFIVQKYGKEFDLSKYMVEMGGTPIRNIIFTTWRSGSTFLGEAITSHPATFYHYEPLLSFEINQVRSGSMAEEGLHIINQLLQCNYTDLENYISYGMQYINQHTHNYRLWKHCQQNRDLCGESDFLSKMCKIFPFQIMKTVRMRLRLAESLLQNEKLNVRILFLVRDPRGTMQSRLHRDWCPTNPDCYDPSRLCNDLDDDYQAAAMLRQKFPDKFLMFRYEDISMNPFSGVKRVLDFFRLTYHPKVDKFIRTHTVDTIGGVSSTFRDSKTTPYRWIKHYLESNNTQDLTHIQEQCSSAMANWGYAPLDLNANNTEFWPLLLPPWEEMLIPLDEEKH